MIKEKSKIWAAISRRIGICFAFLPFPPNFYTWLTLPAAVAGFILMSQGAVILSIAVFVLAGFLDLIDGALARQLNCSSARGAFLDGSLDRFVDFLLIFGYFWLPIQTPWLPLSQWLYIAIFFAIMPSFEVAYANHRKAVVDPNETLIWRFLNRGEMYFLMLLIPLFTLFNAVWAGYLLVALVFLSIITTVQTLYLTLKLATYESG